MVEPLGGIGLTGTFNGMGYAIKDMEIASEREGFFGIVNGGTVKNVAFTDVKSALTEYAYVVANYLLNATLENVYVKTDEYVADADSDGVAESIGFPMLKSAGLAEYYYGDNSMKSCVVEMSLSSESGGTSAGALMPTGILFIDVRDNQTLDCEDVYCISENKLKLYTQALVYNAVVKSGSTVTTKGEIMMGENDGKMLDGLSTARIYRTNADGDYLNANGEVVSKASSAENIVYTHNAGTNYTHIILAGAYRYNRWDLMVEAGENCNALGDTGCWTIGADGAPVWGS